MSIDITENMRTTGASGNEMEIKLYIFLERISIGKLTIEYRREGYTGIVYFVGCLHSMRPTGV